MLSLRASASRLTLALLCSGLCAPAVAASFTVPSASGPQSVSGTDTGTIDSGATLSGTPSAIQWSGAATGVGVLITNNGTVSSSARAIDTAAGVSGIFTLNNTGTVTATDDAFRINGALTNGTVTITNTGTIRSSGGQAFDFDKATAATASVSVTNSGTIETTASGFDAIRLGGGVISITNSGTIQTSVSGKRAIKFDSAANFDALTSFTLTNQAGGLITALDDAVKISSTGASVAAPVITITNSRTVSSTGGGQAFDLGDIASTHATITITNNVGGLITASANDAIKGADGLTVYNYGTISSYYANGTASTQNNSGIKIDGAAVTGGMTATITNYAGGLISGAYHGIKAAGTADTLNVTNSGTIQGRNGSGVNSNGTGTLTNYGTITGTFDPAASFGDGDGVDFDLAATVTNYGTIQGLGSKGIKPGETDPSLSEGIAIGGGTIVNGSADHRSALISGANNGILADDSKGGDAYAALSVTNYGTIAGLDGFGIKMVNAAGTFGNTIVNYGTISGTSSAVATGAGNDLFVYEAGSSVSGTVYAEGGTDTFRLGEAAGTFDAALLGAATTYRDFEILTLAAGAIWTVTGASTFAGATTVADATLILAGASLAASDVTVTGTVLGATFGTLAGTGTVGGLTVGANGIVSPGTAASRFGTLSVAGNATFGDGALYLVSTAGSGASDRIAVSGSTTIDSGAAVEVDAGSGSYSWGTRYTILTSGGGVTGAFGAVSSDYLFLTPTLSYDANDVFLTLNRNDVPFARYAATANQSAAAWAVDRPGVPKLAGGSTLYDDLAVGTTTSELRLALTQLSGDIYATTPGILAAQSFAVGDVLLSRLRQASYGAAGAAAAPLAFDGPVTAYAEPAAPKAGPFTAVKAVPAPETTRYASWAQLYGQWLDVSGDGNATAADSSVGGVLAGIDASSGPYTVGLAAGYSSSSITSGASSADADTVQIAAYTGAAFGAWKLRAGAAYGWTSIDTTRFVALTGEQPRASSDGSVANLFAEAAYDFALGGAALEPYADLGWARVDLDSFTETGAPVAGLASTGSAFDTVYSTLGVRVAQTFALANGIVATPHAAAGWRHAYGDVTPAATLAFLETGSAFTVAGLPIARDSLVASAGLDVAVTTSFTLGVAYEGSFGDGASFNGGKATAALRF